MMTNSEATPIRWEFSTDEIACYISKTSKRVSDWKVPIAVIARGEVVGPGAAQFIVSL